MASDSTAQDGYALELTGARNDTLQQPEIPPLAPVDGGRAAWLFLAGSFCIEMLLWGECVPSPEPSCITVDSFQVFHSRSVCFKTITARMHPSPRTPAVSPLLAQRAQ
jgi:hypothetical protein